ncbi:MAG TPA: hypothetical protein VK815_03355 [Candidatus Acidoferrales bacterium]|jgi:hypothetical protein|nr:hypothetical protein [Candidatus Acidoferrales bacterium]
MFERFKSLFAAKPPVEYVHPEFGVLVLDSELWSGKVHRDGRDIRFYVGGTATTPDDELLDRFRDLLGRFAEVERKALDFIRTKEPTVRLGDFTFYSLDFLWEDKPDIFAMEFERAGDDDGIWRVEFERGEPKFVGRDD